MFFFKHRRVFVFFLVFIVFHPIHISSSPFYAKQPIENSDENTNSLSPCKIPPDEGSLLLGRWCGYLQATAINVKNQILLLGGDGDIELRDFLSGKLLHRYANSNPGIEIKQMDFSPDGSHFAILYDSSEVRLWKTANEDMPIVVTSESRTDCGSSDSTSYLAFSPDGDILTVQLKSKNSLLLWNTSTSSLLGTVVPPEKMQRADNVCFSPDSKLVFWSGSLWDTASLKRLQVLSGTDAQFSPDGTKVASVSEGLSGAKAIDLWEVSSGKWINSLSEKDGMIWSYQFTADGTALAIHIFSLKTQIERIVFWDLAKDRTLPLEVSGSSRKIIGALGENILCASYYGGICEINIKTGDTRIIPGQSQIAYDWSLRGSLFKFWGNFSSDKKGLFQKMAPNHGDLNLIDLATTKGKGFTLSGKTENMARVKPSGNISLVSVEYLDQNVRADAIELGYYTTLFPGKYRFLVNYFGSGPSSFSPTIVNTTVPRELITELLPGRKYIIDGNFIKKELVLKIVEE